MIRGDRILIKYNEIWNKILKILTMKFCSMPVYNEKYIKAKVREFDSVTKTNFLGDETPKENVHYAYVTYIIIDSVEKNVHKSV